MGKGKGKISGYVCPVNIGSILFEIKCCDKSFSYKGFIKSGCKIWSPYSCGAANRRVFKATGNFFKL
jgi:ribosomal protein L16/L10AE